MSHPRDWNNTRSRAFLCGLMPAIIVLVAITVGPAVYLLVTSLTPLNLTRPETINDFSAPLANYSDLASDERFLNSVWIQAKLSIVTVTLQVIIGLGLALLFNTRSSFIGAIRTAFLLPMVLPPIVVAIIWKVLYTPDVSPIHHALAWCGLPIGSLITNSDTALWAIAVADSWEWFPFTMLMVLAALQMMPAEPIEAAQIDGASRFQIFRFVVLPFLKPTIIVAALFRIIDSIKAFPLIYVLTQGGPGDVTEVTNYFAFLQAFNFSYWGYASAIATVMVAAMFVLSWAIMALSHRGEHAQNA